MRFVSVIVCLSVFVLAACGAAPAANSNVVQPAGDAPVIAPASYIENYSESDHILLDVRTDSEVAGGVIPGAEHIPLWELQSRVSELPQDKTIVVYCRSGNRSRQAVNVLNGAGYNQLLDLGGIQQWQGAGYDLVPLE